MKRLITFGILALLVTSMLVSGVAAQETEFSKFIFSLWAEIKPFITGQAVSEISILEEPSLSIQSVENVSECGFTFVANTEYTLNQSVNSSGTCFTIGVNNITLDCQGFIINYSQIDPGHGINITGFNDTTITNCNIIQENTGVPGTTIGISLLSAFESRVLYNNISASAIGTNYGLYLQGSPWNNLTGNRLSNVSRGIDLESGSNNNTLDSNTASYNTRGVHIQSSNSNTLTNNTASSNGDAGIILDSSSDNVLTSNTAENNQYYGLWLQSSSNNDLTQNTANNDSHGIRLAFGSSNNTLFQNYASNNSQYGIILYISGSNNNLTQNALDSNNYGIYLENSPSNLISDNLVLSNINSGIMLMVNSDGNNLTGNIIENTSNGASISSSSNNFFSSNSVQANGDYFSSMDASSAGNLFVNNSFVQEFGAIRYPEVILPDNIAFSLPVSQINISFNSTYVNSTEFNLLNTSAEITLEGLFGLTNPQIMVAYDDVTPEVCPPPGCNNLSYNSTSGTFRFNVSHFTTYAIQEAPPATNLSCGDPLNVSDTVYYLNNSVNSTGTCFTILANNVTLDCQGFSLIGDSSGVSGIYNPGFNYTSVRNCDVYNHSYGIYFALGTESGRIINNTITYSNFRGISISGSFDNVSGNYLGLNNWGIVLESSLNSEVMSNVLSQNSAQSILIQAGSNNSLINYNNISTGGSGIWIQTGSVNNTFFYNDVNTTGTSPAFTVNSASNNNTFFGNIINTHGSSFPHGFSSSASSYNNFTSNNITTRGTSAHGFILSSNANNNTIFMNNITNYGSSIRGIGIDTSRDNNVLFNNVVMHGNNSVALRVVNSASNNTFFRNTVLLEGSFSAALRTGETANHNNYIENQVTIDNKSAISSESNVGIRVGSSVVSHNNTFIGNYIYVNTSNAHAARLTNGARDNLLMDNVLFLAIPGAIYLSTDGTSIENNMTNTTFGTIDGAVEYLQTLAIPSSALVTSLNLDISFNSTYLNSSDLNASFLNDSAEITLEGLFGLTNPQIMVALDDSTFSACTDCNNLSYDNDTGVFVFNVSHFTTYTVVEAPNVTTCGDLVSPDTTYDLTENVNSSGTCFTILANNVTLDCQGFNITGDLTGDGVNNTGGFDSVTIKNCGISGFNEGIRFSDADNSTVFNNIVHSNADAGIYLYLGSESNFTGNSVSNNSQNGFHIDSSTNSLFAENNVGPNGNIEMFLYSGTGNNFINNTINASFSGFRFDANSNNNAISMNTINSNGDGIHIDSSPNNTLENNHINVTGTNAYGVYIFSARYNDVLNNEINSSGTNARGVYLQNAVNNTNVSGNVVIATDGSEAVHIQGSSGNNIISENILLALSSNAVAIESDDNNFSGNTISEEGNSPSVYMFNVAKNNRFSDNIINSSGNSSAIHLQNDAHNNVFLNNNITAYGSSNTAFQIDTHNNSIYGNNIFTEGSMAGINVNSAEGSNLSLNAITINHTLAGGNAYGIFIFSSSNNTLISGNEIAITNLPSSQDNGIYISGGHGTVVVDNRVNISGSTTCCGDGLRATDSAIGTIFQRNNVQVNGTNGDGLRIFSGAVNTVVINNTLLVLGNAPGIQLSDNNATISGNTITNIVSSGITMTSNDSIVSNNNITVTGLQSSGISISQPGTRNSITGNFISVAAAGDNYNMRGINSGGSNDTFTGNRIVVTGNNSGGSFFSFGAAFGSPAFGNNFTSNVISTNGNNSIGIQSNLANATLFALNNVTTSGRSSPAISIANGNGDRVVNNNATTTGDSSNSINIFGTLFNSTISNNIIRTSGVNSNGINSGGQAIANNLTDNSIIASGNTSNGINVAGRDNVILRNNMTIHGNNRARGIIIGSTAGGVTRNSVISNIIVTNGFNGSQGIFMNNITQSIVENNTIETYGSSPDPSVERSEGILLSNDARNNTNIRGNIIRTFGNTARGISLTARARNNSFEGNNITTFGVNGSHGILLSDARGNNFSRNVLTITGSPTGTDTSSNGIVLNISDSNNFLENAIFARGSQSKGIRLFNSSNNRLISNNISANESYLLSDAESSNNMTGTIFLADNGLINYLSEIIIPSDVNVSLSKLNVSFNSTYLNSSDPAVSFLNTSAEITLDNLNFIGPQIIVALDDSTFSVCADCNNLSWNGSTLIFNVSHFTTYAVQETPLFTGATSACGNLNVPDAIYTLNQSVNSSGTCFNIGASNITLDCAGFAINYSQTATGYGVYTSGFNDTTVKNCRIFNGNNDSSISSAYGIYVSSSQGTVMDNNTIVVKGREASGIRFLSSSNNIVSNSNITSILNFNDSSNLFFTNILFYSNAYSNEIINNTLTIDLGNNSADINGGVDNVAFHANSGSNIFTNNRLRSLRGRFNMGDHNSAGNTITNTTFFDEFGEIRFPQMIALPINQSISGYQQINIGFDLRDSGEDFHAFLDSSEISFMNLSAEISFFNVTFSEPLTIVDAVDDNVACYEICNSPLCTEISYNTTAKVYVFNVSHFSTYDLIENNSVTAEELCPTTPSSSSSGGGGGGSSAAAPNVTTCQEDWQCGEWGACDGKTQARACADENTCGTTTLKPLSSRSCTVAQEEIPQPTPTVQQAFEWTLILIIIGTALFLFAGSAEAVRLRKKRVAGRLQQGIDRIYSALALGQNGKAVKEYTSFREEFQKYHNKTGKKDAEKIYAEGLKVHERLSK